MNLSRRSFVAVLTAALCAPAIIRTPGLLMPVRSVRRRVPFRDLNTQEILDRSLWSEAHQGSWDNRLAAVGELNEEALEQLMVLIREEGQARMLVVRPSAWAKIRVMAES